MAIPKVRGATFMNKNKNFFQSKLKFIYLKQKPEILTSVPVNE